MKKLEEMEKRVENGLKSLIRGFFWPLGGLLILHTAGLWYLWCIVPITGDIENQQNLFQRLMVNLGWLSCFILLGISTGVDRKPN